MSVGAELDFNMASLGRCWKCRGILNFLIDGIVLQLMCVNYVQSFRTERAKS